MKTTAVKQLAKLALAAGLMLGGAIQTLAQSHPTAQDKTAQDKAAGRGPVQIVALDECDPKTFNDALGANFCHNVTFANFHTELLSLFQSVTDGKPDPGWDFEPDELHIAQGTPIVVVDQGGEPHTFTEVKEFGNGFIDALNTPGVETATECSGGFKNVAVARTRILQGSQMTISDLSKGEHLYQCCIHPWMRVKVEVK